jgi:hypothetical protein
MKYLLTPEMWNKIEAVAKGQLPLDSILSCHYEDVKQQANV